MIRSDIFNTKRNQGQSIYCRWICQSTNPTNRKQERSVLCCSSYNAVSMLAYYTPAHASISFKILLLFVLLFCFFLIMRFVFMSRLEWMSLRLCSVWVKISLVQNWTSLKSSIIFRFSDLIPPPSFRVQGFVQELRRGTGISPLNIPLNRIEP